MYVCMYVCMYVSIYPSSNLKFLLFRSCLLTSVRFKFVKGSVLYNFDVALTLLGECIVESLLYPFHF